MVDNGSTESPDDVVATFPIARLVAETTPGPGPARSHGARLAKGELLAFIDADCIAAPDWLAQIAKHMADHPDCDVLGGDVRIARVDPANPTPIEAYEAIWGYRMKLYVERDRYTATCNMAVRRNQFLKVGDFVGIETAEDVDWGRRASDMGLRIDYVPEIRIETPARESFTELTRKWDRHIGHDYAELSSTKDRLRWIAKSLALAVSPFAEIPKIVRSDRVSGASERWRAFRCLSRIRLFRARRMLGLLVTGDGRALSGAWNRR